jgi:hypothetical protein
VGDLLTVYLWIVLLSSLLATGFLATKVTEAGFKIRLASYLALYNVACILLRMVMPTREMALTLNWMNPLLGLTMTMILPFDRAFHVADPAVRIAIRATATLLGSTAIWVALGWVLGTMLDDRMGK